jgi:hypothetical protein
MKVCFSCEQQFSRDSKSGSLGACHCRLCGRLHCFACATKVQLPAKFEKKPRSTNKRLAPVCGSCCQQVLARRSALLRLVASKDGISTDDPTELYPDLYVLSEHSDSCVHVFTGLSRSSPAAWVLEQLQLQHHTADPGPAALVAGGRALDAAALAGLTVAELGPVVRVRMAKPQPHAREEQHELAYLGGLPVPQQAQSQPQQAQSQPQTPLPALAAQLSAPAYEEDALSPLPDKTAIHGGGPSLLSEQPLRTQVSVSLSADTPDRPTPPSTNTNSFWVEAMHSYENVKPGKFISFSKGDLMRVTKPGKQWHFVVTEDRSQKGWIPNSYVKTVDRSR